jgi:hypothetical protein
MIRRYERKEISTEMGFMRRTAEYTLLGRKKIKL